VVDYSGKAADIWALGVTLYGFVFNKLPFNGETEHEICQSINSDPLVIPDHEDGEHDKDLIALIEEFLHKDPS
jgi:[calcium/calmodulin-dependent protein kinase] kinase